MATFIDDIHHFTKMKIITTDKSFHGKEDNYITIVIGGHNGEAEYWCSFNKETAKKIIEDLQEKVKNL